MIDGKSIQWHFDAMIETWNEIAENGYLSQKQTTLYKRYKPICLDFICEVYAEPKFHLGLDELQKDKNKICKGCPFTFNSKIIPLACTYRSSLLDRFKLPQLKSETRKKYAIAIAQLFIDNYPEV